MAENNTQEIYYTGPYTDLKGVTFYGMYSQQADSTFRYAELRETATIPGYWRLSYVDDGGFEHAELLAQYDLPIGDMSRVYRQQEADELWEEAELPEPTPAVTIAEDGDGGINVELKPRMRVNLGAVQTVKANAKVGSRKPRASKRAVRVHNKVTSLWITGAVLGLLWAVSSLIF